MSGTDWPIDGSVKPEPPKKQALGRPRRSLDSSLGLQVCEKTILGLLGRAKNPTVLGSSGGGPPTQQQGSLSLTRQLWVPRNQSGSPGGGQHHLQGGGLEAAGN